MKYDPFLRRIIRAATATASAALVTSSAFAATTFQGPGTNWIFPEFWSGGLPNASTDVTAIASHNVVLGVSHPSNPGGYYETGSEFYLTGGSFEIFGNGKLKSSNVNISRALGQTASVTVSDPGAVWVVTNGLGIGYYGNGTLTLKSGALLVVQNGVFVSAQAGTTGTLNIGDYSGGTTGGTLDTDGVHMGTSMGRINFNQTDTFRLAAPIDGNGHLYQRGTGTTVLARDNPSFTGNVTVSAGTLQIGEGGTSGSLPRFITNNATVAFNRSNTLEHSNTITGTGKVVISGSGIINLVAGNNSYTGGTFINAGILRPTYDSALPDNGPVALNGGALVLTTHIETIGALSGTSTTSYIDLGNQALRVNQDSSATYAGSIGNSLGSVGQLIKLGSSILTLTGSATHAGGTIISAGTLQIGNGGNSGNVSGNITNNSNLTFNRSDDFTHSGVISGGGSVTKQGAGTLILTGANTYSGGTTVNAGALRLGASSALADNGPVTLNGGALLLATDNETIGTLSGASTASSIDLGSRVLTIDQASDATYAGSIGGSGGQLIKIGSGYLAITGSATHTGGTVISAGILQIGDGGTSGSLSGNISSTNFGSLIFFRSDAITYSGVISGNVSVTKAGSGTLILTGTNTYTGETRVNNGALQIGDGGTSGSIRSAIVISQSRELTFNRSDDSTYDNHISGSGSVTKQGAGTLILNHFPSHTGGTTISAGTLQIGDGGGFGSVSGNFTNDANLVFNNGNSSTYSGVISGSGTVVKQGTGTLILTGANTYSGVTTISAGALQLGTGAVTGSISGNITNNGALVFNPSANLTFDKVISGTGTMTKSSARTLVLTGANTFTGGTTVVGGSLQLGSSGETLSDIGAVHVSGSSGSIGTLALGAPVETIGSLTVSSFGALGYGVLAFDISSAASYERLAVTSGITLNGGNLRLTLGNGYVPAVGASFDLLDWGTSLTGTFTNLELPSGITWNTSNLYTNGTLSVVAIPEPSAVGLLIFGGCLLAGVRRRETGTVL